MTDGLCGIRTISRYTYRAAFPKEYYSDKIIERRNTDRESMSAGNSKQIILL